MYIVDIWGGENSQDHVAGFVRSLKDSLKIIEVELLKGFLVNVVEISEENIRKNSDDFDNRLMN